MFPIGHFFVRCSRSRVFIDRIARVPGRTGGCSDGCPNGVRSDDEETTTTTSLLEARVDVDVDVVERGDETRDANEAGERRGILATTTAAIGRSVDRSVGRRDERRGGDRGRHSPGFH